MTPVGPWKANGQIVVDKNGYTIAIVQAGDDERDNRFAKLMALAPEMAEALVDLCAMWADDRDVGPEEDRVVDIVAKIEGILP